MVEAFTMKNNERETLSIMKIGTWENRKKLRCEEVGKKFEKVREKCVRQKKG